MEQTQCARVFVSDVRSKKDACELLATVMEGDVAVGDLVLGEAPLAVTGLAHACKTCSFGDRLQEGDRGVIVVSGDVSLVPTGKLLSVVRG